MTRPSQDLDIETLVNQIMIQEFEVEEQSLRPSAHLADDLGLDSLDGVDLVVALEKSFQCRIAEEEAREIKTLADIYQKVRARLAETGGAGV